MNKEDILNALSEIGEFQAVKRNAQALFDGQQKILKELADIREENKKLRALNLQRREQVEALNARLARLNG